MPALSGFGREEKSGHHEGFSRARRLMFQVLELELETCTRS
jgi:hypothetical protein